MSDSIRRRLDRLTIGDRVKFDPHPGHGWWFVQARDDRYLVCTRQAPFERMGLHEYTVVDLDGWSDGVPRRSSLNALGGGWEIGENGDDAHSVIDALRSEQWQLSTRRMVPVRGITLRGVMAHGE